MITVYSPRIHNLGDFMHCLPTLSGLHKKYEEKISFGICNRLERFKGIKELLLCQDMFEEVKFMHEIEQGQERYVVLDDTGDDRGDENSPTCVRKFHNFIIDNYNIDYELDNDFILKTDNSVSLSEKIIVGDRWSPNDAPDVDIRRKSNLIESSGILPKEDCYYLDYTKELMYNCNLIKNNPNPFITTFTGIGIVADLMKKETIILWDEDMRNWQGWGVEKDYAMHYYKDRNSKLIYIKDYNGN